MKSTGRSTMTPTNQELEDACQVLGVSYDPVRAPASAADILDAVRQRQKCQHCTRVREQAAECVCVGIDYCDGTYVLTARQCIPSAASHRPADLSVWRREAVSEPDLRNLPDNTGNRSSLPGMPVLLQTLPASPPGTSHPRAIRLRQNASGRSHRKHDDQQRRTGHVRSHAGLTAEYPPGV